MLCNRSREHTSHLWVYLAYDTAAARRSRDAAEAVGASAVDHYLGDADVRHERDAVDAGQREPLQPGALAHLHVVLHAHRVHDRLPSVHELVHRPCAVRLSNHSKDIGKISTTHKRQTYAEAIAVKEVKHLAEGIGHEAGDDCGSLETLVRQHGPHLVGRRGQLVRRLIVEMAARRGLRMIRHLYIIALPIITD